MGATLVEPLPQFPPPAPTEQARSPEQAGRVLWQKPLAENFLYPEGQLNIFSRPAPSTFWAWSGETVFVRGRRGTVQEIHPATGKTLWEWREQGAVLAGDEEHLFLLSEDTKRIHILDARTHREVNRIPPPPGLTRQEAQYSYRWPAHVTRNELITPVQNGVRAFSRRGTPLWQDTDIASFKLLSVFLDEIIVGKSDSIDIIDVKTGKGPSIPTVRESRISYSWPYVYSYPYMAVASSERQGVVHVYDPETRKRVVRQELPEWKWHVDRVTLYKLPIDRESGNRRYSVELERKTRDGWLYGGLAFDTSGRANIVEPKLYSGRLMRHSAGDPQFLYQEYPGILQYLVLSGSDVLWLWSNNEVSAIDFLGWSDDNYIFANWNEKISDELEWGRPRIYSLDPKNGKERWPSVRIDTKRLPKTVVRNEAIYVISEQILRIDGKTGKPKQITYTGSPAKWVMNMGTWSPHNVILVETEDNRLIAFST